MILGGFGDNFSMFLSSMILGGFGDDFSMILGRVGDDLSMKRQIREAGNGSKAPLVKTENWASVR